MKKFLILSLLSLTLTSNIVLAGMSDSRLTDHDEETYRAYCSAQGATPAQCACMVKRTLGVMDANEVHIALVGQESLNAATPEENQRLLDESNQLAGGEDAAMEIDDRFEETNNEALRNCSQ